MHISVLEFLIPLHCQVAGCSIFKIVGYDAAKNYMFLEIKNWFKWLDCDIGK